MDGALSTYPDASCDRRYKLAWVWFHGVQKRIVPTDMVACLDIRSQWRGGDAALFAGSVNDPSQTPE